MATIKITALPAASDVTSDDLVPIVNAPGTSPETQKATAAQVKTFVNASIDTPGNFAVNTNKFNVTASSGNTTVAGTLGVTGDVAINTNKFNVTASSGDTAVAGDLNLATGKVFKINSTSVLSGSTLGSGVTASSLTSVGSLTALTVAGTSTIQQALEKVTASATAATGTINFDALTQSVLYYTSNASANWTVNFRGSSGTSLDTMMATGQSLTVAFLVTQGSTAYYASAHQIDGSSVTPVWQGGTAPTSGNASGIDAYVYTIIKTASATFKVLASQTQFK